MPLKHQFSRLFNKSSNGPATQSPPTQNPWQPAPAQVPAPAILPTITEDQEHERAIFAATINSLQDENARLEVRAEQHTDQISKHQQAESHHTQEISYLNGLVNSRNTDNMALQVNLLDAQRTIAQLQANLRTSQEQNSMTE